MAGNILLAGGENHPVKTVLSLHPATRLHKSRAREREKKKIQKDFKNRQKRPPGRTRHETHAADQPLVR